MYALIIFIHLIFISINLLLGNKIFAGIFFLLGIFFLFYFSPLFFLDENEKSVKKGKKIFSPKEFLEKYSPKKSLLLPATLLYVSIYGFIYAIFRVGGDILYFHAGVVMIMYLIFFSYSLIFYWKNDVFFEALRFHTIFTLITTIIFAISILFSSGEIHIVHPLLGIFGILSSTIIIFYQREESSFFLAAYLAGLSATGALLGLFLFPGIGIVEISMIVIFFAMIMFELAPRSRIFRPYTHIFRYFSLISLLIFTFPLVWYAWIFVGSLAIMTLAFIVIFFLSIHRRYTNYIVYSISIFLIFFLYATVFIELLQAQDILSFSLFVFFLPVLLIGSTFFWEEAHMYDFSLLHYSSIAFSSIVAFYAVFFLTWSGDILFVVSLSVFGIALLFFLSYFRLRSHDSTTIHL